MSNMIPFDLTPSQADDIGRIGEHCRRAIETQELDARIKVLETKIENKGVNKK